MAAGHGMERIVETQRLENYRMQLFQKFRPRTLSEIAGHEREKQLLARLELSGRAWWITGLSGTGKTTVAKCIGAEIADPLNVTEIDAGELTPAKLSEIERESHFRGIGDKPGRCYIVNESHGLRKDTVRRLLVTLERIPEHVSWIFTTTVDGMAEFDGIDSAPLLSRCACLNLKPDREAFAERAMRLAQLERLDGGAPLSEFARLLEFCGDNLRMALSQIETGIMLEIG